MKVSARSKGKGFQGTIRRHNFHRGPGQPRLAQRPGAGLDRSQRDARARDEGHAHARPDGQQAHHPARPRDGGHRRRAQPAAGAGVRCRARPAASSRSARGDGRLSAPMSVKAPKLAGQGSGGPAGAASSGRAFTAPSSGRRRAPSSSPGAAARRQPARAARSEAEAPSRGARRGPGAPASARSALPTGPAAAWPSARRRAATPSRSTARHAAGRCVRRSACTPSGAASPSWTPAIRAALDEQGGRRRSKSAEAELPVLVLLGARRSRLREVVSQHRAGERAAGDRGGRGGRARCCVGDRLPGGARGARRAAGERPETAPRRRELDGRPPGGDPPGRVGEELRADRAEQVHVSRPRRTPTRRRSARPSRRSSTSA